MRELSASGLMAPNDLCVHFSDTVRAGAVDGLIRGTSSCNKTNKDEGSSSQCESVEPQSLVSLSIVHTTGGIYY